MVHMSLKHYSGIISFFMVMMFVVTPNNSHGQVPAQLAKILKPALEKSLKPLDEKAIERLVLETTARSSIFVSSSNIRSNQMANTSRSQTVKTRDNQVPTVVHTASPKLPDYLKDLPNLINKQKKGGVLLPTPNEKKVNKYQVLRPSHNSCIFGTLMNDTIDEQIKKPHLINGQGINPVNPIVDQSNSNDSIVFSCLLKIQCKDITIQQREVVNRMKSCITNKKGDSPDVVYSEMRKLANSAKKLFPDDDPDLEQLIRILSSPPIETGRVFLNNGIDSMPQKSTKYRLDWRQ